VTAEPDNPLRRLAGAGNDEAQRPTVSGALTPDALLDSALPSVVFVTAYAVSGQRLQVAIWSAVVAGVLLAVLRLARRSSLQNVIAGFLGVAIAAFFAARTGRAQDFFLPGLLINAGYAIAYTVSILVRWPLLGVFVGTITGEGMAWRRDPVRLRAYALASWIWVAMFLVRLAVQLPLYLVGEDAVVALGVVRLALGWPLFFVCVYLSWVVIRSAGRRAERPAEPATS
jgi:hypothetical protein